MRTFKRPICQIMLAVTCFGAVVLATPLRSQPADPDQSYEGFREIRVAPGESTKERLIDLLLPFIGNHPESLEGNPSLKLELRKVDDMIQVDLEMGGYLDDSVSGEHWRGHIIETPDGWELLSMAVKQTCWRGEAPSGMCN